MNVLSKLLRALIILSIYSGSAFCDTVTIDYLEPYVIRQKQGKSVIEYERGKDFWRSVGDPLSGRAYFVSKTRILKGERGAHLARIVIESVDKESLTGWAGNFPEFAITISRDKNNEEEVVFRGLLSVKSNTWVVVSGNQGASIENVSDIKKILELISKLPDK